MKLAGDAEQSGQTHKALKRSRHKPVATLALRLGASTLIPCLPRDDQGSLAPA